jgi:hypothetical protein
MKKNEVEIGGVYVAKISGRLTHVRITAASQYGGWIAVNVNSNREVRIRTAAKLRGVWKPPLPKTEHVPAKQHTYEVIVGNIGSVYVGPNYDEAQRRHDGYVVQSQGGYGRAAGETVIIMRDGEIYLETES